MAGLRRRMWAAGAPARLLVLLPIRLYRVTVGQAVGGRCRFYPSCSEYAERSILQMGAIRGSALALWRVLRCSPLSRGGVDHPPARRVDGYDDIIRSKVSA